MASTSTYIRVHPQALVEYIQDDSFYYADNYSIVNDTLNSITSFEFSKIVNDPFNYNKIPNQLYLIDPIINKFGIADPDINSFLQEVKYPNPAPSRFDKVKIWFPIYWTFADFAGMYLKIYTYNYTNTIKYGLSNFYLDSSNPIDINKLTLENDPLRLYDTLWGKSITLYVPSVNAESQNRTTSGPILGTINYNLTSGNQGLSTTSPIYIDFRYLTSKQVILGTTVFFTTPPLLTSTPQAPQYSNLAVSITEATDGDYFLINGIYNNSISEFNAFMNTLASIGQQSYILFTITNFEEGLPQDTTNIYVYQNFSTPYQYRPIFKFTNTTASIQVQMSLINSASGATVNQVTEITVSGTDIGKYGKYATPINISSALAATIYNVKPSNNMLPAQTAINYALSQQANAMGANNNIKYVSYPVLTNITNIVADLVDAISNGETYYGLGGLELVINPFDNVIKMRVAERSGNVLKPMSFPTSGSTIQLVFKSSTTALRVDLYMESNQVDLVNGVLVFKILATDYPTLKTIFATNSNFYLTITTNSTETVVYDGVFSLLEDVPRNVNVAVPTTIATNITEETAQLTFSLSSLTTGTASTKPIISTTGQTAQQIIDAQLTASQLKQIK